MSTIEKNINIVKERIEKSCLKSGRTISEIKLIAVSKTIGIDKILECFSYGILDFGENRVQEIIRKLDRLKNEIKFHLIGHLQTNKVKNIVGLVKSIQSVDSIRLAEEINERSKMINTICDCLIQINTSKEDTKFGMDESQLELFLEKAENMKNIRFNGLMTIGTFTDDEKEIRRCFTQLRKLKDKYYNIKSDNIELKELSMGMTNDYEIALEEGSTILRIGTAIFGERNYQI